MNAFAISTIFLALSATFSGVDAQAANNNNLRGATTTTPTSHEDSNNRELATFTLQECKDQDAGYHLYGATVSGETMIVGEPELAYRSSCPKIRISGGAKLVPVDDTSYDLTFESLGETYSWTITGQYFDMFTLTDVQAAMAIANTSRKSTTQLLFQNFGFYTYRFLGVLLQQPKTEVMFEYKNPCHFFLSQVVNEEGAAYLAKLPTDPYTSRIVKNPAITTDDPREVVAAKVANQYTNWLLPN